jgi:regulator of RNase E activity RraA
MIEKPEKAIKNGQSRDTDNIGHTRHKAKTNKTKGTIKNGQSRDTDNIGHTRHKAKIYKTKTQHRKQKKKISNTDPPK